MSQKEVDIHKQIITNFSLLNTPYSIFQSFFSYHNILSSDRLWSKLIKMIALTGECQVKEIIQGCLQLESQSRLQHINGKFTVMGVLILLIVTWIRLGKTVNNLSKKSQDQKVEVYLKINQSKQSPYKQIEVSVKSKQKLKKEQTCKYYHQFIVNLCKRYGFSIVQSISNEIVYLQAVQQLIFYGIKLPSIMEIIEFQKQTKSNLIMRIQTQQAKKLGLCLQEYVNLLKHFEQLHENSRVMSLKKFVNFYCKKIKEMLQQSNKKFYYYFMLSPKTILVIERKQKSQLTFYFNLKKQQLYYYNKKKVPVQAENFLYSHKSSTQTTLLQKIDPWSAGLSILALIAPYQSLQFFQKFYQKMEQNGLERNFLKKQVDKLSQNRDISTQFIIDTLKKWLRLTEPNITQNLSYMNNVLPFIAQKKSNQQTEPPLMWLRQLLDKPKNTEQNLSKNSNDPQIRNAQTQGTTSKVKNVNQQKTFDFNNENKNYIVHTLSSSTSYQTDNSSNNNNQTNLNKYFRLDQIPKKGTQDIKWNNCLQKLKSIGVKYNAIYNIFGIIISEEKIKLYKEKLSKNKNVYEELGYYSKGPLKISKDICLNCKTYKDLVTDYCGHDRCLLCYEKYVKQKFNDKNFYFLICPDSRCDNVVSQQLMQYVVQNQNGYMRQQFLNQLMKYQVSNKQNQIIRRCNCSQKSSYFQTSKYSRLFLCDQCLEYKCSNCASQFHGSIECEYYASNKRQLADQFQKKLNQFNQTKKLVDFRSIKKKKNLQKLLNALKIKEIKVIYELQAALKACVAQVWAIKIKQLDFLQRSSQNILIVQQVITKLSLYLIQMYSKLSVAQFKPESHIANISQQMKPNIQRLLELHSLIGSILYVALS